MELGGTEEHTPATGMDQIQVCLATFNFFLRVSLLWREKSNPRLESECWRAEQSPTLPWWLREQISSSVSSAARPAASREMDTRERHWQKSLISFSFEISLGIKFFQHGRDRDVPKSSPSSRNNPNHLVCLHSKTSQRNKQIFWSNTFFFSMSFLPHNTIFKKPWEQPRVPWLGAVMTAAPALLRAWVV